MKWGYLAFALTMAFIVGGVQAINECDFFYKTYPGFLLHVESSSCKQLDATYGYFDNLYADNITVINTTVQNVLGNLDVNGYVNATGEGIFKNVEAKNTDACLTLRETGSGFQYVWDVCNDGGDMKFIRTAFGTPTTWFQFTGGNFQLGNAVSLFLPELQGGGASGTVRFRDVDLEIYSDQDGKIKVEVDEKIELEAPTSIIFDTPNVTSYGTLNMRSNSISNGVNSFNVNNAYNAWQRTINNTFYPYSNPYGFLNHTYNSSYHNTWQESGNETLLRNGSHADLGYMETDNGKASGNWDVDGTTTLDKTIIGDVGSNERFRYQGNTQHIGMRMDSAGVYFDTMGMSFNATTYFPTIPVLFSMSPSGHQIYWSSFGPQPGVQVANGSVLTQSYKWWSDDGSAVWSRGQAGTATEAFRINYTDYNVMVEHNATIGSIGNPGCLTFRDADDAGWSHIQMLNGAIINGSGAC